MELMERYLYDIGRRLPARQREDIVKELRSLLSDALDARTEGREPTEEDVVAVITAFGSPASVASRYAGERYLIGPRMFDLYWLVLRIVLAAMSGGLLVALIVSLVFETTSSVDVFLKVLKFVPGLFTGAITAFGYVTAIFFLIERFAKKSTVEKAVEDDWKPRDLPNIPVREDRPGKAGPIVAICFTLLGLLVFNFYPQLIAYVPSLNPGTEIVFLPLLSEEALAAYLPFWNVGMVLTLVLQSVLLARGRWEPGTRVAYIVQQLFAIGVLGYMMNGPALVSLEGSVFPAEASEILKNLFLMQFRWVFVILIVLTAIDIVKTAVLAIRSHLSARA